MSFEALKRVLRQGTIEATAEQKAEIMSGYPVIENVTGLPKGTVITKIGGSAVIVPQIRGEKMSPTIVLEGFVGDDSVARPIYLSSLIRKKSLDDPFEGMIAEDDNFKGHENFTNEQWVAAFKAAAPFHVSNVSAEPRVITTAAGERTIKPKVLTLKKR